MSIVALARKSRRYKARVSGQGSDGFSLNGGTRNQGWVGQSTLGRSLGGTRFRGAEPMGSGGVGGRYKRSIVNGGRPCTNDPSIIKRSSGNTPGLISSRMTPRGAVKSAADGHGSAGKPPIQNIPGTCCTVGTVWVQGDAYNAGENSSQSTRLDKLKRKSAACVTLKTDAGLDRCGQAAGGHGKCKAASYHIGGKKFVRTMYSKNLNRLAVDQSQYLYSGLMAKNDLPTPSCKASFPPVGKANKWCGGAYKDPELAKAAGLLPSDWGDCKKCLKSGMMNQTNMVSQKMPVHTSLSGYSEKQREGLDGQRVRSKSKRKVLCLHGGGGSGNAFANQKGMLHLTNALADEDFEFVFIDSLADGIWIEDGKYGSPVSDSARAKESIAHLNRVVAEQGPFYGILGYSQGATMALVYLASLGANAQRFERILLSNGYMPTYNQDLMAMLEQATSLKTAQAMVITAVNDTAFYNLSREMTSYFNNAHFIVSVEAGHALPVNTDNAFTEIIDYLR